MQFEKPQISASYAFDTLLPQVIEILKRENFKEILDIGGNDGSNSSKIIEVLANVSVTSFDIRASSCFKKVKYVQGDAREIFHYFPANSFDFIMMLDILEHIPETDAVIRNVSKLIRDSGLVLITTPNLSSLTNRIALLLGYLPTSMEVSYLETSFGRPNLGGPPVGHVRVFTFNALVEFLSYHGFDIIEQYTLPRFYHIDTSFPLTKKVRRYVAIYNFIENMGFRLSHKMASGTVIICKKR